MKATLFIKELKTAIYKVRVLKALLGSAVIFLLAYGLLMLVTLPTLPIALSFGVLYFITEMVIFARKSPLQRIEEQYDDLDEALRSVEDTLQEDNEMVQELRKEAVQKAKKEVDVNDFISFNRVASRSLFIIFLSFTVILFAALNIRIVDAGDMYDGVKDLLAKVVRESTREKVQVAPSEASLTNRFKKVVTTAGLQASEDAGGDIFGDTNIAQLGGDTLDVEIRPTDFEVSVHDYKAPEDFSFSEKAFQSAIDAQESAALEEDIPQAQQAVVKRYFESIASLS